jgi:hypothetical protein
VSKDRGNVMEQRLRKERAIRRARFTGSVENTFAQENGGDVGIQGMPRSVVPRRKCDKAIKSQSGNV